MKLKKIYFSAILWALLSTANFALSENMIPVESFLARSTGSLLEIVNQNFNIGEETIIDTFHTNATGFSRGVDWQSYDHVQGRIFFQEALTETIIRTHVYEISTRRYFQLPYNNYMGQHVEMIISPDSKYIIFTYMYVRDTIWSSELYKTVVLNGDDLSQLSESVGLSILEINLRETAMVTGNNRFMFNWDFIQISDSTKEHAYIIYSLPDLIPIDTVFHSRVGWNGAKSAFDYSESGLLFIGSKSDSSRNLPPGAYAFILNASDGQISSIFIRIVDDGHFDARLSPDGQEIIVLYYDRGLMRRYSLMNGRQIGQMDIPVGASFQFGFFGTDGNLYLRGRNGENIIVDFRNNKIERIFRFVRGE